jgi:RluA family pseudouridine synthase
MSIAPDRILYEDEHLLIVNKRAGELVVAGGKNEGGGELPLFDYLRKDYPGLRVVHRLDYGTSGILVFARTKEAVEKIRDSKFEGWEKRYRALVAGRVDRREGVIRKPLKARTHEGLVEAVTQYKVLATYRDASYIEAKIDTGRKHQIRQHFASIGHPLFFDPLYGDKKKDAAFRRHFRYKRFFLHAADLRLPHPITGEKLHIEASLPPSFEDVLNELRYVELSR